MRWKLALIVLLIVAAVAMAVFGSWSKRKYHEAAVIINKNSLRAVATDWEKAGRPEQEKFLVSKRSEYGSFNPFVFTNTVQIGSTNYSCLFAVRSPRFAEPGMLAITREGAIIWVGQDEKRIIETFRE